MTKKTLNQIGWLESIISVGVGLIVGFFFGFIVGLIAIPIAMMIIAHYKGIPVKKLQKKNEQEYEEFRRKEGI